MNFFQLIFNVFLKTAHLDFFLWNPREIQFSLFYWNTSIQYFTVVDSFLYYFVQFKMKTCTYFKRKIYILIQVKFYESCIQFHYKKCKKFSIVKRRENNKTLCISFYKTHLKMDAWNPIISQKIILKPFIWGKFRVKKDSIHFFYEYFWIYSGLSRGFGA